MGQFGVVMLLAGSVAVVPVSLLWRYRDPMPNLGDTAWYAHHETVAHISVRSC